MTRALFRDDACLRAAAVGVPDVTQEGGVVLDKPQRLAAGPK